MDKLFGKRLKWVSVKAEAGQMRHIYKSIPIDSGVYVLRSNTNIYYIGSSDSLRKRLRSHVLLRSLVKNKRMIKYLFISYAITESYFQTEQFLISISTPTRNKRVLNKSSEASNRYLLSYLTDPYWIEHFENMKNY